MKLSPHIIGTSRLGAEMVRRGALCVKMVDDFSLAAEAATLPHRPLMVGRVYENDFDPNALAATDPVQAARNYITKHLDKAMRLNPAVPMWEGPNECVLTQPANMRWYAAFLREFARVMRGAYAKTPVIGSWAVGNPADYGLWAYYWEALYAAKNYGAVLSRHNYAGPDQTTWPDLLLRHRKDNAIFAEMGFPDLPLIISEAGADAVAQGNPRGQPWKDLFGDDPNGAARYVNETLLPFAAEIEKDKYVLAATVYSFGLGWPRHNLDNWVGERLVELTRRDDIYTVTPTVLNVRRFPWMGIVTPPLVRQVTAGERVRVYRWYRPATFAFGWACISSADDEWVSGRYLVRAP